MALYGAEGIVLGARNWGEADKIVTVFTRRQGILRAAAFGCRRPRSPLAGAMQMFVHADLQLAEGARLETVKTASVRDHHAKISLDLASLAYATFVAEVIREFLPEGVSDEAFFDRLVHILTAFETRNPRVTALASVVQILAAAGLQQSYERCIHCGKAIEGDAFFLAREGGALCADCRTEGAVLFSAELRELLIGLQTLDWQNPAPLRVRGGVLMAAEAIVLAHVRELVGHPLRSLDFLAQLA
ncbi:DNA repair protein RecO [Selenomonas noxia ATCC 43541]|uniref:DNA repair protein RecO n=1 Tax=Selenomonas noxia TaxID=135083 RepID=UPI0001BCCDD3|nr:DNA repair protein RecO [Selenomonas noxia]EFF66543.1 DNA repair protein RecO [Selenomonas noxia ATCC 43541]